MSLLDQSITDYVMNQGMWGLGSGDILDQTGAKVGSTRRKMLPMLTEIELMDVNDGIACIMRRKTVGTHRIYSVEDTTGKVLGLTKKGLTTTRHALRMYDPNQKELFKASRTATKWDFSISSPRRRGRTCAFVRKASNWERVLLPGSGFKERYVVHIQDPEVDRLLLIAYAIIIDDTHRGV